MADALYYRDYLQLDKILNAQHLISADYGQPAHDELLFIITHQAYELWFKQVLAEVDSVRQLLTQRPVPEKDVATIVFRLGRVNRILDLLVSQFGILETMTALDFMRFRQFLFPASGFQSLQFRVLQAKMGLQDALRHTIKREFFYAALDERDRAIIDQVLQEPSLFRLVERWLEAMPFMEAEDYTFWEEYRKVIEAIYARDRELILQEPTLTEAEKQERLQQVELNRQSFEALFDEALYAELQKQGIFSFSLRAFRAALFIALYRDYPLMQLPYRLLDGLAEFDELMGLWRYRHARMAARMIGSRIGTGGSSGVEYLMNAAVRHKVFEDITNLSSFLIPPQQLPPLPEDIARQLHFVYEVNETQRN